MSAPLTTVRPTVIGQNKESPARTTPVMERKLVAILSADVKGYSRLMGEDELATVRTLTAYRDELMSTLVQQHGGNVVGAPGKGRRSGTLVCRTGLGRARQSCENRRAADVNVDEI